MTQRQSSAPHDLRKHSQRVTKRISQPTRSSARLKAQHERSIFAGSIKEQSKYLPSPDSGLNTRCPPISVGDQQDSKRPPIVSNSERPPEQGKSLGGKRKRPQDTEAENLGPRSPAQSPQKRPRRSSSQSFTDAISRQEGNYNNGNQANPVEHWALEYTWPRTYFEPDSHDKNELKKYLSLEEYLDEKELSMAYMLARRKSSPSLSRRDSGSSAGTPSDQKPRVDKCAPYRTANYETVLATKGSFMKECKEGIPREGSVECDLLLSTEQYPVEQSLFRDDQFEATCEKIRNRNEDRVIRDVSLLIVPSPEILETQGATHLEHLIESLNEGWNSSISFYSTRPQPDFSVGFQRSAFTEEQLGKLAPFVGEIESFYTSYFMATWQMYFPFLTCEVKCGAAALNIADRQNAHSMTLAVRGVFELFKLVNREKELDRTILAFSISHDHSNVRIYGHYPVITDGEAVYYRHPIRNFSFTEQNGKEKWTAYKFTKNVYDIWMPGHVKRICSAIDQLPENINFRVSTGDSIASAAGIEVASEQDSQEMVASAASSTAGYKKPRLRPTAMIQEANVKLQKEKDELRDQVNQILRQQQEQQRQQQEQQRQQQKQMEQMERQRIQEREDTKQQMEQMERQRVQEKEDMKQQMDNLISLLKQSK